MSNSSLVTYTDRTSHYYSRGGAKIDKIFVHHMAGNLTVKQCGNVFKSRQASANYGINGKNIGLYVDESNGAWHCSNASYNKRSIGIECANDGGASSNWHVSDTTIATLIDLMADIAYRNGFTELKYTGNLNGNVCLHCFTAATACPGGYMKSQIASITKKANTKLQALRKAGGKTDTKTDTTDTKTDTKKKTWTDYKVPFTVRVKVDDLYIKAGAGTGYKRVKVDGSEFIKPGVYTIIEVKKGEEFTWGKLKSSTAKSPRWIALDYTTFVKEVKS